MLSHLSVKNLSILEEVNLDLHPGLNILTGETGAGKSFIFKSLALLTGARASAELVRKGADKSEVVGIFQVEESLKERLLQVSEEVAEFLDDELLVKRVIEKNGKSKCYVNGSLVSVSLLSSLGSELLEITGQHQQQGLLSPEVHRTFVDNVGVPAAILEKVRKSFKEYKAASRLYEDAKTFGEAKQDYFRRLSFECEELEQAALVQGEKAEIQERLERISKSESVLEDLSAAEEVLDNEEGIERQISKLNSLLSRVAAVYPEVDGFLDGVTEQLAELRIQIADAVSKADVDPEEAESLRSRLSLISKLERKYNSSSDKLVSYFQKISQELEEFQSGAFDLKNLQEALTEKERLLKAACGELRTSRRKVCKKLCKEVEDELKFVEMKNAKFEVRFEDASYAEHGDERVEFLIAPNPGQGFSPLAKSASGGELSRILLVLKTIFGRRSSVSVQLFDEVDSGVGGSAAQKIGEKLASLSERSQVLVITHSPQVAAFADKHHHLSKAQSLKDTVSIHKQLSESEQVMEIARMLAGEKVTKQFKDSAQVLIKEARSSRAPKGRS